MSAVPGYAVIDTETTGKLPGFRHRIAEVAVVQLDADGVVTGEWSTLVNPERDLGPQAIHGIRAAEARRAPRFSQIAGDLVELVQGRIPVAHNWQFDAMHLHAEFARISINSPFHSGAGLCTMHSAGRAMPRSGRSLVDACASAGITDMHWHTARDDAMAAARLLGHLLMRHPRAVRVTGAHLNTAGCSWPRLPHELVTPVHRTPVGHVEPHFLARLVERLPHDDEPAVDSYFAMLDDALADRQISAVEAEALLELAHGLGMHKADAMAAHHTYLRDLAHAAWADGVITPAERRELETVAIGLGIDPTGVAKLLKEERHTDKRALVATPGGLSLRPGDKIVLTGTMKMDRTGIIELAKAAGLRVTSATSRQTRVVVAADPDSQSGKAEDARKSGVQIVTEDFFMQLLERMVVVD